MQISTVQSTGPAPIKNARVLKYLKDIDMMCLKVSPKICSRSEQVVSSNHVSFIRIIPSTPDAIKLHSTSLYKSMGYTYIPLLLVLTKRLHHPTIVKNVKLDSIDFLDENKRYYVVELTSPTAKINKTNKNIKLASNRKLHSVYKRIMDIVHSSRNSISKTVWTSVGYKEEMLKLQETKFTSRTVDSYSLESEFVNESVSSWKQVIRRGMRDLFKADNCCDLSFIKDNDFVKDAYYGVINVSYNTTGNGCKISAKVISGNSLCINPKESDKQICPIYRQMFLVDGSYTKPEQAEEVVRRCIRKLLKSIKRQSAKRQSAKDFFEGMILRTKNKSTDTIADFPEMIFDLKTPFVSKGWLVIAQCKNTGNIVAFQPKVLMLVANFENITVLETIKISNKLHNHLAIYNVALNAIGKYAFGSKVVNANTAYSIQLVKNNTHESRMAYADLGKMRKIRRQNLCESILSSYPGDNKSEVDGLKDVLKLGEAVRIVDIAPEVQVEVEPQVEADIPSQEFVFSPPKPSKISYPSPRMSLVSVMNSLVEKDENHTKAEERVVQLEKELKIACEVVKTLKENEVVIQTNFYQLQDNETPSTEEMHVLMVQETKKFFEELKRYDLDTKLTGKLTYMYSKSTRCYVQTLSCKFV